MWLDCCYIYACVRLCEKMPTKLFWLLSGCAPPDEFDEELEDMTTDQAVLRKEKKKTIEQAHRQNKDYRTQLLRGKTSRLTRQTQDRMKETNQNRRKKKEQQCGQFQNLKTTEEKHAEHKSIKKGSYRDGIVQMDTNKEQRSPEERAQSAFNCSDHPPDDNFRRKSSEAREREKTKKTTTTYCSSSCQHISHNQRRHWNPHTRSKHNRISKRQIMNSSSRRRQLTCDTSSRASFGVSFSDPYVHNAFSNTETRIDPGGASPSNTRNAAFT